jgi:hypothetical protein
MVKTLFCFFTAVNAVTQFDDDVGVLMQSKDTSASLSIDMADVHLGSQTTKLEESLHSTLLDVVKDPETMKRLPTDWLRNLRDQMELLQNATKNESAQDQAEIKNASTIPFGKCTAERATAFVEVDKIKDAVSKGRDTHADCRNAHVTMVDKAQKVCNNAERDSRLSCKDKPSCACSTSGCDTIKANVACQAKLQAWLTTYKADLVAKDKECDANNADCQSKMKDCDQAQKDFEANHCGLSTKLLDTCLALDNCYINAKDAYDSLKTSVQEKEASQKLIWTGERKISCYLDRLEEAYTRNLVQADIAKCVNLKLNVNYTVDHLNIQYPAPPGKDTCDDSFAYWQATEYDALNATYIQPTTKCCLDSVATTTTTTTSLPTVKHDSYIWLTNPSHSSTYLECCGYAGAGYGIVAKARRSASTKFRIERISSNPSGPVNSGDRIHVLRSNHYVEASSYGGRGYGVSTRPVKTSAAEWQIFKSSGRGSIKQDDLVYFRNPSHGNQFMEVNGHAVCGGFGVSTSRNLGASAEWKISLK